MGDSVPSADLEKPVFGGIGDASHMTDSRAENFRCFTVEVSKCSEEVGVVEATVYFFRCKALSKKADGLLIESPHDSLEVFFARFDSDGTREFLGIQVFLWGEVADASVWPVDSCVFIYIHMRSIFSFRVAVYRISNVARKTSRAQ